MTIHIIANTLGAGKTLLMVFLMIRYKLTNNQTIFSNFDSGITDIKYKTLKEMNILRNGLLAIDDAYMLLNSRDIKGNIEALEILARSRKRKLEIIMSTVRAKQIDINVRRNTEIIWFPKCVPSPIKNNPPIALVADCHKFLPGEEEEEKMIGAYIGTIKIIGNTLRKGMAIYDTTEEINKMD